jgi:peroxiredoxin Q/BCP
MNVHCASLCLAALFTFTLNADDEPVVLEVGDPAPSFTVQDDQGNDWSSEEHFAEGTTVVYFYPADCTGGCTRQAQAYNADLSKLNDLGVAVVGVSGDTPENHQHFKELHDLQFPLLADVDGEVAKAFGVPYSEGESTVNVEINGEQIALVRDITTQRWTFIIRDGVVIYKNPSVNAAEDCATIQTFLSENE